MLVPPHAEVIATHVAIQVIVEGALLAVFEQDADQAGAADDNRGHLLNHDSSAPLSVVKVDDLIPEPEVEALFLVHIRS